MKKLLFSLLILAAVYADVPNLKPPPVYKANCPAHTCQGLDGFFVTGEFIYWKARQDELINVAVLDFVLESNEQFIGLSGKDLHFEYDAGFKVGLGGNVPFDGWDIYLNWTHLHNHTSTKFSSTLNDLIPTGALEGGAPILSNLAHGTYDVMFNTLDFDWGRRHFVSDTWTVRTSFGGKVAWIHQRIHFKFENLRSIALPGIGVVETPPEFTQIRNDFWGIGPYASFNGKWNFGWGFGLLGQISGALLWGEFDQKAKADDVSLGNGGVPFTTHIKIKVKTRRVRPTVQFFIGLDWEWCFIPDHLSTQFRIGYETQYFWQQLLNTVDIGSSDLTYEGLTFMGRIDF